MHRTLPVCQVHRLSNRVVACSLELDSHFLSNRGVAQAAVEVEEDTTPMIGRRDIITLLVIISSGRLVSLAVRLILHPILHRVVMIHLRRTQTIPRLQF